MVEHSPRIVANEEKATTIPTTTKHLVSDRNRNKGDNSGWVEFFPVCCDKRTVSRWRVLSSDSFPIACVRSSTNVLSGICLDGCSCFPLFAVLSMTKANVALPTFCCTKRRLTL